MKLNKLILLSLSFHVFGTSWAEAQQAASQLSAPAQEQPVQRGRKAQSIKLNFEDELVSGAALKPDMETLSSRKNFNFKKIIRIRENFLNEMEDSVDSFKAN